MSTRSFRLPAAWSGDRKSTRLNSSHEWSSYAVFCLKKKKLARAFEPALILSASGLHRSRANRIACLGNGFIIQAALVRQEVIPFHFHGFAVFRTIDDLLKRLFQRLNHVRTFSLFELADQRLHPLFGCGRARSEDRVGDGPEMLGGVVEVQHFSGSLKALTHQVTVPRRAIRHDQDQFGLQKTAPHRFSPELLFQLFQSASRHDVASLGDKWTPSSGLAPLVESKAGRPVNPVPARELLARHLELLSLAPIVSFANVPGV